MMACVISSCCASVMVFGISLPMKRVEASTASPSQWPDTRAWFTMRAHARASADSSQSPLACTQISGPEENIVDTSFALNSVGVAAAPKLGKAKPSGFGFAPLSTSPTDRAEFFRGAELSDAPPPPPHAARSTATPKVVKPPLTTDRICIQCKSSSKKTLFQVGNSLNLLKDKASHHYCVAILARNSPSAIRAAISGFGSFRRSRVTPRISPVKRYTCG